MKRFYIDIKDGLQMHYRKAGKGQPIVLFHPSPRSSKMLEPFGTVLSAHYTTILPDLFGYGQSDSLPINIESLYDYLPYLRQAFQKMKLPKMALYGSATGAQLAIAYALTYPEDVSCLFLDNAAHFTDAQREAILKDYFINLTPQYDGTHLPILWQHLTDSLQFFPWFDKREECRILALNAPKDVLAAVNQGIVVDYLVAGKNYADAYRAAFAHEKAENVQALKVPTVIFKWAGSPLLKYIEALTAHSFPPHISVENIPPSPMNRDASTVSERFEAMKNSILINLNT
jgi:pimeloyl-ACP methyl ester carboxylesterase